MTAKKARLKEIVSMLENIESPLDDQSFAWLKYEYEGLIRKIMLWFFLSILMFIGALVIFAFSPFLFDESPYLIFISSLLGLALAMVSIVSIVKSQPPAICSIVLESEFSRAPPESIDKIFHLRDTDTVKHFLAGFKSDERKRPICLREAESLIYKARRELISEKEERDVKRALNYHD